MLVNNFKRLLAISMKNDMGFKSKNFSNATKNIPMPPGSNMDYAKNNLKYVSGTYNNTNVALGLVIGSGGTTPKLTDYKLENEITTGFTENTGSVTFGNGKTLLSMTITAGSTITINEVGVRLVVAAVNASSTRDDCSILLTRSVLPEPIMLQSNQTKVFVVEIDYNSFIDNVNNL